MTLINKITEAFASCYGKEIPSASVQLQPTRSEFEGDVTLVVFPLLKFSGKKPEDTAADVGQFLLEQAPEVERFNVVKGFLNLVLADQHWSDAMQKLQSEDWWRPASSGLHMMVEYSSPNTNKPLHLGHIRNNLLGWSVAEILKACGHQVTKVNLVNDRGIHICKSMLAWQKWGNSETPASSHMKGDALVGKYYVLFDQKLKEQIRERMESGMDKETAENEAPLMEEARDMLRDWEADVPEVRKLWETMNAWVYAGFESTYRRLGVDFNETYYESKTYLLGKAKVEEALQKGVLYRKEDGSVWIDLEQDGLDQKLLLRSDGTSVYMTQDIGTAIQRFESHHLDRHIYVVGNEQDYHFKALALILKRMGYQWADHIHHLSYGMVDLPSGKMKSREGTVVDADDLMSEVVDAARVKTEELGKLEGLDASEAETLYETIGLGALKYFILKVDPRKRMLFNPEESIEINGNTGPFIQYTHARISSVLRKAEELGMKSWGSSDPAPSLHPGERGLIKVLLRFPEVLQDAGAQLSPALMANYSYELAKEYNQFYHDCPVIKAEDPSVAAWRLALSAVVQRTIRDAMGLLGIHVPERM